LCLNRKLHRAFNRVRDNNFRLDGLLGFDLHGKTVGIIGTGKIGAVVAQILHGFGCHILAYDNYHHQDCIALGVNYVTLTQLLAASHIVTLHCPLTPDTHHLIDNDALQTMRPDAMLINTSRGGLVDTSAVIRALKARRLGALGIDVYEEEGDLFFEDLSDEVVQDDVFSRLLTFPNVLITGHQAFFTREALQAIAETTLHNVSEIERTGSSENEVKLHRF
ncbi:MAG: 2-hydroxyacid dehydrogenase, partial [Planctomycetales bacterium]|nr:2-hydroxyacid dehydrogenase [Planctomycetales bacterium]